MKQPGLAVISYSVNYNQNAGASLYIHKNGSRFEYNETSQPYYATYAVGVGCVQMPVTTGDVIKLKFNGTNARGISETDNFTVVLHKEY